MHYPSDDLDKSVRGPHRLKVQEKAIFEDHGGE